eukprot:gb/GECH01006284.1/.p1 GENE.gb/GECH01006284.1/~~gb/GECH01006284.1/.p1  ORF type:complete len:434 (+),score=66.92 gb/GECH01006284.1/:1-1302(+)
MSTQYEIERQRRIERNRAMLQNLGIEKLSNSLGPNKSESSPNSTSSKLKKKRKPISPPDKPRKSQRLSSKNRVDYSFYEKNLKIHQLAGVQEPSTSTPKQGKKKKQKKQRISLRRHKKSQPSTPSASRKTPTPYTPPERPAGSRSSSRIKNKNIDFRRFFSHGPKGRLAADVVAEDPSPVTNPVIMFTGIVCSPEDQEALSAMGAELVTDTEQLGRCTHLVTYDDRLVRTQKLLRALCHGAWIMGMSWVHRSVTAGVFLAEENYLVTDPNAEARYRFRLSHAMTRVRETRHRVFAGCTLILMPDTSPSQEELIEIITAGHGSYVPFSRDALADLAATRISPAGLFVVAPIPGDGDGDGDGDLVLVREYLPRLGLNHYVTPEFVMRSALRQQLPTHQLWKYDPELTIYEKPAQQEPVDGSGERMNGTDPAGDDV